MFLEKYVNNFYYEQILDNYKIEYLHTLDEQHFLKIYKLFLEYKLDNLKEKLGNNFTYIIGNNMNYLEEILK